MRQILAAILLLRTCGAFTPSSPHQRGLSGGKLHKVKKHLTRHKGPSLGYTSDEFLDNLSLPDHVDNPAISIQDDLLPYCTEDFFSSLSSNHNFQDRKTSPSMHPPADPFLTLEEQVSLDRFAHFSA